MARNGGPPRSLTMPRQGTNKLQDYKLGGSRPLILLVQGILVQGLAAQGNLSQGLCVQGRCVQGSGLSLSMWMAMATWRPALPQASERGHGESAV